jgi:hypothetical protein
MSAEQAILVIWLRELPHLPATFLATTMACRMLIPLKIE